MNGGLFGLFTGGQPSQAQQPQQQAPAQASQQQAAASQPAGQPGQQSQQAAQPAQQQQQVPAQAAGNDGFNLLNALGLGEAAQPAQSAEQSPEQLAQAAFSALLSGQTPQNPTSAPAINFEKLAGQLSQMDFTQGVDFNGMLGLNLDEAGDKALRGAFNGMQMQTMATMVPLMNALVSQAMQSAVQTSQSGIMRDQSAQAIVQTFVQSVPYGNNAAIQPVVQSLANLIAQQSPKGVDPRRAAQSIQSLLSTLGTAVAPQSSQASGPAGGQDMTSIFN